MMKQLYISIFGSCTVNQLPEGSFQLRKITAEEAAGKIRQAIDDGIVLLITTMKKQTSPESSRLLETFFSTHKITLPPAEEAVKPEEKIAALSRGDTLLDLSVAIDQERIRPQLLASFTRGDFSPQSLPLHIVFTLIESG